MELPAAKVIRAMSDSLSIEIPESYRDAWLALAGRPSVKKSRQLYVKIEAPRKPRTTGKRSQNTHIWGHAQQIAEYTGDEVDDVITEAKRRATRRGYPTRENSFGVVVPVSERSSSTTEAAMIIEELHMIASDLDVRLKEYPDE